MKLKTYLKIQTKKQHMINTDMLPLKMVVLVTLAGEAQIFHQHFQMYLKTFLEILWVVTLGEDLAPPQEEGQI